MVDLLRSLEWQAGYNGHACPSCRACEVDGHTPTCRLARAIRELAEESPGEPLDIPATAAFIRDHVAIADRVLGPVVDGPAICPPPRTTRPILPPEPTVDEMAREMGLTPAWRPGEWTAPGAEIIPPEQIRTLYREHRANAAWADSMLSDIGRKMNAPPTDPAQLAAWLYARVGHGTWAEWVVPGNPRPSKEEVTGCDFDDGAVWLDLAPSGRARIPSERGDQRQVTRLLNPDGSVLWEAT